MKTAVYFLFCFSFNYASPVDWRHFIEAAIHETDQQEQENQNRPNLGGKIEPIIDSPLSNSLTERTPCHDTSLCGRLLPSNQFCVTCPSSLYTGGGCPEQQCLTGGKRICEWVIMPVPKCELNMSISEVDAALEHHTLDEN